MTEETVWRNAFPKVPVSVSTREKQITNSIIWLLRVWILKLERQYSWRGCLPIHSWPRLNQPHPKRKRELFLGPECISVIELLVLHVWDPVLDVWGPGFNPQHNPLSPKNKLYSKDSSMSYFCDLKLSCLVLVSNGKKEITDFKYSQAQPPALSWGCL